MCSGSFCKHMLIHLFSLLKFTVLKLCLDLFRIQTLSHKLNHPALCPTGVTESELHHSEVCAHKLSTQLLDHPFWYHLLMQNVDIIPLRATLRDCIHADRIVTNAQRTAGT